MPFKPKVNIDRSIVFAQSHEAKIALYFSDKYHLVNAYNLAVLAELSYDLLPDAKTKLMVLNTTHEYPPDPVHYPRFKNEPILVPYSGEKKYASEGFKEIVADFKGPNIFDTQGFHYNDGTYNVIVFRGTQQHKDFLTDGYAPKIAYPGGEIHEGFYQNFSAIREIIKGILESPVNKKCKTIITGHSLGGALGTIVASFLSNNYRTDPCGQVMLYTFGSPRVGTKKWVDFYTTDQPFIHFRHRRKGDPISMLPPHHSSMRLPSLPNVVALAETGVIAGGNIGAALGSLGGPVGTIAGAVVGAAGGATVLVGGSFIFNSAPYYEAFVHHGQGILLHHDYFGYMVVMGSLPPETLAVDGKLLNGKEVLLAREFMKNVVAFKDGVNPYSISGYVAEIQQLMIYSITGWDHDSKSWLEIHTKTFKHYEAEYLTQKKSQIDHEMNPGVILAEADVTNTMSSHPFRTYKETKIMHEDLTNYSFCAKKIAESEIEKWSQPDSKAKLFDLLLGGGPNPSLERELLSYEKKVLSNY